MSNTVTFRFAKILKISFADTKGGDRVCNFDIWSRTRKGVNGQPSKGTRVGCRLWGEKAVAFEESNVREGDFVDLDGILQDEHWMARSGDSQGQRRTRTVCEVEHFSFPNMKGKEDEIDDDEQDTSETQS